MTLPLAIAGLVLVWFACLAVQYAENRALMRELRQPFVPASFRVRCTRLAWSRSALILVLLAVLSGATTYQSWKLNQKKNAPVLDIAGGLPTLPEKQTTPTAAPVSSLSPAAGTPAPAASPDATPATIPATAPPAPVTTRDSQINDIFQESTPGSPARARLDEIKQRYENLFINYFFHSRCGKASEDDYFVLNTMLLRELASTGGPSRMQEDIMTAARGSYDEVYDRIPCDKADSALQAAQFRAYVDSIRAQLGKP